MLWFGKGNVCINALRLQVWKRAQSRNGLLFIVTYQDRPGKLCRFIPNTDDGVWDCSPGSSFVYSCGSFSARTSLTHAFHNSTMLIAASEYWHKVLLWFSLRLSLTLGKRNVLCCTGCLCYSKAVMHPPVVTACNTQTICKEMALQHLLLLAGQFSSLLCRLSLQKQNWQANVIAWDGQVWIYPCRVHRERRRRRSLADPGPHKQFRKLEIKCWPAESFIAGLSFLSSKDMVKYCCT